MAALGAAKGVLTPSHIQVSGLDGLALSIDVQGSQSPRIGLVRRKLSHRLGAQAEELRLIAGTRILEDWQRVPLDHGSFLSPLTFVKASRLDGFLARHDLKSVAATTADGSTPLHLAASRGDASLCAEILAHEDFGAAGRMDFLGSTALHHAAARGLAGICAALLTRSDFSPEAAAAVNRNGNTALHLAALRGDGPTTATLLSHPAIGGFAAGGAGPGTLLLRDVCGRTPVEIAQDTGQPDCTRVLEEAMAFVTCHDGTC